MTGVWWLYCRSCTRQQVETCYPTPCSQRTRRTHNIYNTPFSMLNNTFLNLPPMVPRASRTRPSASHFIFHHFLPDRYTVGYIVSSLQHDSLPSSSSQPFHRSCNLTSLAISIHISRFSALFTLSYPNDNLGSLDDLEGEFGPFYDG